MESNTETEEVDIVPDVLDSGRRRAMRKIAVGIGALAGLSVLPEQWTRPLIGRIVIPAHAATSGEVVEASPEPAAAVPCTLTPGCYQILAGPVYVGEYLRWLGGIPIPGPVPAEVVTACDGGGLIDLIPSVIASSRDEAEAIFPPAPPGLILAVFTVDGLPPGCNLYGMIFEPR